MLTQRSVFIVELQGKRYEFHCDNDSPLGCVHDALMQVKGWAVEKMITNQKQEEEMSKQMQIQAEDKPDEPI